MINPLMMFNGMIMFVMTLVALAIGFASILFFVNYRNQPQMPEPEDVEEYVRKFRKKRPNSTKKDIYEACLSRFIGEKPDANYQDPYHGCLVGGLFGAALFSISNHFSQIINDKFFEKSRKLVRMRVREVLEDMDLAYEGAKDD